VATVRLDISDLDLDGVDAATALLRAVTGAQVIRTTDGASTVKVTCDDPRREVLNLPVISAPGTSTAAARARRRRQTTSAGAGRSSTLGTSALAGTQVLLTFAGMAYVLVQVSTSASTTSLTFEDSVVAALRSRTGPQVADRASVTRSEFIQRLARDAKVPARVQTDERIPKLAPSAALTAIASTTTPDLSSVDTTGTGTVDITASTTTAAPDPASAAALSTGALTPAQIAGLLYGAGCSPDKVPLYTAIALAESQGNPLATNHNTNGTTDFGLFQINSIHSNLLQPDGAWQDPAANTAMAKSPELSNGWVNPAPWSSYKSGAYQKYLPLGGAAASAATAAGPDGTPLATSTAGTHYVDSGRRGRVLGTGQWQRGTDQAPNEDSWSCVVRLAQELNWRAFSDGSGLWVGSDAWLKSKRGRPVAVAENANGVQWLSGEWDGGKVDGNDLSFTVHAPWPAVVGQAVSVSRMGRLSGSWLVHSYVQSTTDREAVDVTLSRGQDDVLASVPAASKGGVDVVGGLTAGGETTNAVQAKVLAAARSVLGTPYVSGGTTPAGFDCSGFTQWCWAQAGVTIPRTSQAQKAGLPAVPGTDWLPGDLLFFYEGEQGFPGPGHVGLYIGGGQVIHCPHEGDVVRYEDVSAMPGDGAARPPS